MHLSLTRMLMEKVNGAAEKSGLFKYARSNNECDFSFKTFSPALIKASLFVPRIEHLNFNLMVLRAAVTFYKCLAKRCRVNKTSDLITECEECAQDTVNLL
jgi:hypothetical protein